MADERELNQLYKERAELLKTVEDTNKRIQRLREEGLASEKEISTIGLEAEKAYAKARDIQQEIDEARGQRLIEEEQSLSSIGSIYSEIVDSERTRLSLTSDQAFKTFETLDTVTEVANITKQIAQLNETDLIAQQELATIYDTRMDELRDSEEVNEELLQHLEAQFGIAKKLTGVSEEQIRKTERLTGVYDGLRDTLLGVLETAETILTSTGGLIGGAVIGLGSVVDNVTEVNRELGIGITNLSELNLSAGALSFAFAESTETARQLSNQLGSTEEASFQAQLNTNLIAETMGVSATEASTLVGFFSRLNDGSTAIATDMIATTREFALQNNVIPADVMGDLAANTEAFALYGKEGGQNLIEAATYARQLGTTFETLTGIADNLLDFESSITKELELSAMLGRQINLDRARGLAYQGEIKEAVSATLDELGGVNAFREMGYYQQKQTADLLGISVAELSKMAENQDKIATSGDVIRQKFSGWNESLNAVMNKFAGISLQGLGGMLVMIGDVGQGLRMLNLHTAALWAKEKAIVFWQGLKNKLLGTEIALKQKSAAAGAAQDLGTGGTGKKGPGKLTNTVGKLNAKSLMQGAAALALVAGSVFILAKAFQEFAEVDWDNLDWRWMLGGAVALSALTTVAAVAGAKSPLIFTGAAAMAAVAGSIWILAKAFQAFASGAQVLSSIQPTISTMIDQTGGIMTLTGALFSLAGGLAAVGAASLFALPALTGIGMVTGVLTTAADAIGMTEEPTDKSDAMLAEIRGLRQDLNAGKVAVYIDRDKVSKAVAKGINESRVNATGVVTS